MPPVCSWEEEIKIAKKFGNLKKMSTFVSAYVPDMKEAKNMNKEG
jgi:hypothetical protein